MIFTVLLIAWFLVLYGAAYWSVGYLIGRYLPPAPHHQDWDEGWLAFAHASWGLWAFIWPLTLVLAIPVTLTYAILKGLSTLNRGYELGSARRTQRALQKEGR